MSLKVKNYIIRDYKGRLGDEQDALVISVRGVSGIDTNRMRVGLRQKNIQITVVRNALARKAIAESGMAGLSNFLTGPSALAHGGASVVEVAREIMKWAEQIQQLELKGAILDGQLFEGKKGVERLSKFPTREEAVAQTVTLILSPARKLASQVLAPGSRIASCVKTIQDKLEKGETVARLA